MLMDIAGLLTTNRSFSSEKIKELELGQPFFKNPVEYLDTRLQE